MSRIKYYLLAALAWLALATPGLAQSSKLSALTGSGAVVGAQLFYCATGGTSLSCTAAQVAAFNYSLMSGDCTATSTGAITCTQTNGNSFGVLATLNGSHAGDIAYWNGTTWALFTGNTTSTAYFAESSAGVPSWQSGTSSITATTSCPATTQTGSTIALSTGSVALPETGAYTVLAADCRKVIYATAGPISLPALAGLVANFGITVINSNASGGANVVLQTTDSSLITTGGLTPATSVNLTPGMSLYVLANGPATGWVGTGYGPGASAGAITGPGYSVGAYYQFRNAATQATSATGTNALTYCGPGWLDNVSASGGGSGTVTTLQFRIIAAGTSTMALAIYSDQLQSGVHRPGTVIGNTAAFADTATGQGSASLVSSISLSGPALYWLCSQVADSTVTYSAMNNGAWWGQLVGGAGVNNMFANTGFTNAIRTASTFGTWPNASASWTEVGSNNAPWIVFQFSSIP